jgi:Spy/CpxP family protein refolding chaperone
MKRWLLGVCVVALAVPVVAQEGPIQQRGMEAVANFLQLTPEQVDQWKGLLDTQEAALAPLRDLLRDTERALGELLRSDNPDPTAVGSLVLQGKNIKEQMGEVHRTYLHGFEGMLTPEQAGRLAAIRRAERLEPLFPAFRLFGLLPPPPPGPAQ